MLKKRFNLAQSRLAKVTLEIIFITLVYLSFKTYMQIDLVSGKAPDIEEKLLSEQIINLHHYRGQPLLIHFWATWCSICKLEENSIDAISKDYPVITIAMNSGPASAIERYLHNQNLDFPVVVDEHGSIAKRYGVKGVPTSFVLDGNGNIAYTEVGLTTAWGLRFRLWLES